MHAPARSRNRRRPWILSLIAAASIGLVAAPSVVIAAETVTDLPAGVVADGSLEVTVHDENGDPVDGADVSFVAMLVDPPDGGGGLAKVFSVTGPDGVVTFSDLPRPDEEGPAIEWNVIAQSSRTTAIDGCSYFEDWFGALTLPAVAGATQLTISMTKNVPAWGGCEGPAEGSPTLTGFILDPDGQPFSVESASIEQVRPEGGAWSGSLTVDAEGRYETLVHAWGAPGVPSDVYVRAIGPATVVVDGACSSTLALVAEGSFQFNLTEGSPEVPTIYASLNAIAYGCDPDAGPGDDEAAAPTPPPSDLAATSGRWDADGGAVLALLIGLASLILVAGRGISRGRRA